MASDYVKCRFQLSKEIRDIDYELKTLQDNVYNCFKQTYGTVDT